MIMPMKAGTMIITVWIEGCWHRMRATLTERGCRARRAALPMHRSAARKHMHKATAKDVRT